MQIFLICRSVGIAAIFKTRNRDLNFADSACSEGLKEELHSQYLTFHGNGVTCAFDERLLPLRGFSVPMKQITQINATG